MSDLFDVHSNVQQADCDRFAKDHLQQPCSPVPWQGYYSYTLLSEDQLTIMQFRAAQSPLDQDVVNLARQIHPQHVPVMTHLGLLPDSDVSIWKMDNVPGKAFVMLASDVDIQQKLPTTMVDMARFYAAAWKCPQVPSEERLSTVRRECRTKLNQLEKVLPRTLQPHITQSKNALLEITEQLPWVLTHDDLSNMNILLDGETGHLEGIVDWADAALLPFGMALWGLESVLGYSNASGWTWLEDDSHSLRAMFFNTFKEDVGDELSGRHHSIEMARILGLLLRYGFVWHDNSMVPTTDTTLLTAVLDRKLFLVQC